MFFVRLFYQYYDPDLSDSKEEPRVRDRQYSQISFGSGDLFGYSMKDVCTVGDRDSDDSLIIPDF